MMTGTSKPRTKRLFVKNVNNNRRLSHVADRYELRGISFRSRDIVILTITYYQYNPDHQHIKVAKYAPGLPVYEIMRCAFDVTKPGLNRDSNFRATASVKG